MRGGGWEARTGLQEGVIHAWCHWLQVQAPIMRLGNRKAKVHSSAEVGLVRRVRYSTPTLELCRACGAGSCGWTRRSPLAEEHAPITNVLNSTVWGNQKSGVYAPNSGFVANAGKSRVPWVVFSGWDTCVCAPAREFFQRGAPSWAGPFLGPRL